MKAFLGLAKCLMLGCAIGMVPGRSFGDDLIDDKFVLADKPVAIPIERAVEFTYPNGARQSIVVCDNTDQAAIIGFYWQLLGLYNDRAIRNTYDGSGAFIRVRTDVSYCTRLNTKANPDAPFETSWSADADLTYVFFMKQTDEFGIRVDGGEAVVLKGVNTSVLRRRVYAYIDWDAIDKILSVTITDFDLPFDTGVQTEAGTYVVTGRSVNSTLDTKNTISSSFTDNKSSKSFSIGASSYLSNKRNRMRVMLDGATYYAEFGVFSATEMLFSNRRKRLDFTFGARWVSSCDIAYREQADYTQVACKSSKKFKIGFKFTDKLTNVSGERSTETGCISNRNQLPVLVSWTATPTMDTNTTAPEGLFGVARFCTEVENGVGRSWYQARMAQGLTWIFRAAVTEGSGPVINVRNLSTSPYETKRYNAVRYVVD
jgi:hypothetical protein